MESIPRKRQRFELDNTNMEKSNSTVCEDIVGRMDIDDDEEISHLCEKESEVDDALKVDSNITNDLKAQTACQNTENLFQKYFMLSDKKHNDLFGKEFGPSQFHQWGSLTKIKERSCTLNKLININLEELNNCKDNFIKILEELEFEYNIVKLNPLDDKKVTFIFAFDIKSDPKYSFCGYGATEDVAIEMAAKNGLEFFIISCH